MNRVKKLYRSRTERMIAGVCGGIAEFSQIDVTLVRIGFVILTFFSGLGIILYLIMAIIVPEKDEQSGSVK